jgi:phospholipase C
MTLETDRRRFLSLAAGATVFPAIARALELPAARVTGTIDDVEYVVILMQENRAFDHYFGTLRGVRGFDDPRAISLPNGDPVWRQPKTRAGATMAGADCVAPFHLDTASTRAQSIFSLDHSWKGSHALWKDHDCWVPTKGPMTMGYFKREDIPFYYALADAFTICDGYHASIHGPTNPNRLFLFTGTSGLAVGRDGGTAVANPPDETNETADPANDSKTFKALDWTTYAERLEAAGVSWKLYQEFDNYGDNALAYFAQFRGLDPASSLHRRGRAWVEGASAENARTSRGDFLVRAFAKDVAAGELPRVSWIVTSYPLSEHPQASPAEGQRLVARLIEALTARPDVWAKTVFILNYDENDGFFDHVPPPVPAIRAGMGKCTTDVAGEIYHGEPVGLGPRVPLLVVSPWTRGGFVNSQTFDHTSVIRFLERRFGVMEPQITPWRRAVCGDLTSVFDFETPNAVLAGLALPDTSGLPGRAAAAKTLPWPTPPAHPEPARQEPGRRLARPLPYRFEADTVAEADGVRLRIVNQGEAGATFNLYGQAGEGPWFYTVGAGLSVEDHLPISPGGYDLSLHGPNGFFRRFRGTGPVSGAAAPEVQAGFDPRRGVLHVTLTNAGTGSCALEVASRLRGGARRRRLGPGAVARLAWPLRQDAHWYDLAVTSDHDPAFLRHLAGHGETGRPSLSDPGIGRGSA